MLLNHYTAFLEKHLQGKLGSLVAENGSTLSFSDLGYQLEEALLPMLLHQVASIVVGSDNTAETGVSYCLKKNNSLWHKYCFNKKRAGQLRRQL